MLRIENREKLEPIPQLGIFIKRLVAHEYAVIVLQSIIDNAFKIAHIFTAEREIITHLSQSPKGAHFLHLP
jgi:hypothetical protein